MKILFANVPIDGHFNPLTGIAMQLKKSGHDVRWYTGSAYAGKLKELEIPYYPFQKAVEITDKNTDEVFPERKYIGTAIGRLKFDLKYFFVATAEGYFEDIKDINEEFPFDILVSDQMYLAAALVKIRLNKLNVSIGVTPYAASSRSLPPAGLGMVPSESFMGRARQNILRFIVNSFVFNESTRILNDLVAPNGVAVSKGNILNIGLNNADLYLQSGTPGFEYSRNDITPNYKFAGPLLPFKNSWTGLPFYDKLKLYSKVILVTQGTFEKNPEKLIIPTLEAFKNTHYLVVATTGGSETDALKARFPQHNIIIEDYIDFDTIMPLADVYVTNGGYGGVLMSINHSLPMVAAGLHEGKLEITARIGYFGLGINLKTETPGVRQIKAAVEEVLINPGYKISVKTLSAEFKKYNSYALCEDAITELYNRNTDELTGTNYHPLLSA